MGRLRKISSTYAEMDSEEAKRLRKDVSKKIEYQKKFDAPEAPSRIYHGSQNKIDKFEARPHYLAEDEPVVFGTPSRTHAISFLAPWRDSDFEQGTFNGDPTVHMTEQYPGAFEKIYKGRKGYLYELDSSNFEWGPQLMRSEFISREVPEVLNSEELDVYEAMLAEEAAGRLKIHRAKEKTAQEKLKSAVIIKGNPYYLEQGPDVENYANYYKEIEDELRKAGYGDITYDSGDDYTTPRDADLWVGHSRGAGRLRLAPKGTKTLDVTQYEDGIEEYKARLLKEMREKGYSSMGEFPVEERTRPGSEHYTVTDRMREAIQKTASEQDQYVYHAVPRGNRDSVAQRGILSGAAILEDPEMLKGLAKKRNWTEEQTAAKIRKNLEDEYWRKKETSPSVFFSEPDWSKVPEWHTLRQDPYDLYRINLSKYMREVPGAKIHGVELKPWVEGTPYEERDITLEEAAELASRGPKGLWKDYSPIEGYYAVDVPHAFLRSDANKIPAEYVELMGELTPGPLPEKQVAARTLKEAIQKTASEQDFAPDFTPEQLKELGVYDQVYGDAPSEASMKEWPEHWINEQDPLGWLQWYDRYSQGRRTDDDSRQIKRWKSFKARHLAQYLKNPTPRRAAALRNWGIDVSNNDKIASSQVMYALDNSDPESLYHASNKLEADLLRNLQKTAAKGTATKRDPKKWSAAKSRAKAKMGGKWSARAAQLAVKYYKDSGGTYSGKKPTKGNNKLKKWTKEEWGYRPGSKAEKDSKKSPSSGTKGRYLPKKKWQSLSKPEQKATDAKKREGMNKGKGIVANTAKAKYDSKKDYTKKGALADSIIKNASAALVGGYVGSQVAGKDNTIAGAATGAALGKGTALATYGWHSQPMLKGILGADHMKQYVNPGDNLWKQTKGAYKATMDPQAMQKLDNWRKSLTTWQGWKDSGKAILGQNLRKGAIGIGAGIAAGLGAKYLGWGGNPTEKTSSQQLYGVLGNAAAGALGGYMSSGDSKGGQGAAIGALAGAIGGTAFSKGMNKMYGKGTGQALNLLTLGTPAMAAGGIASSMATEKPTSKLASSISALKYPEGVSPRFQGYISQKRTKLTTPVSDLPQPPPPANDSEKTLNELLVIKMHMEEGKLPESLMILADREPEKIFYIACEKFGIDPKKEQAAVIKEDFNKIAFDLKYIFKRPRPWSLSDYHGVNLNVTVPESADTPSYPSGHAMMGYGLAEFYKAHYPEYSKQWDGIADIIQHSRLQSGVHFPSDNEYSKQIVDEVSSREKVSIFFGEEAVLGGIIGGALAGEGNRALGSAAGAGITSALGFALTPYVTQPLIREVARPDIRKRLEDIDKDKNRGLYEAIRDKGKATLEVATGGIDPNLTGKDITRGVVNAYARSLPITMTAAALTGLGIRYKDDIMNALNLSEKTASKAKLISALGLGAGTVVGGTMLATPSEGEGKMLLGNEATRLALSPEDSENWRVLIEEQPEGKTWVERNLYRPEGYEVIFEPAHLYKEAGIIPQAVRSGLQRARGYAGSQYARARGYAGRQYAKAHGAVLPKDDYVSMVNPYLSGGFFGAVSGGMTAENNKLEAMLGGAATGALLNRAVGVRAGNIAGAKLQGLRRSVLGGVQNLKSTGAGAVEAATAPKPGFFGRVSNAVNPKKVVTDAATSAANSVKDTGLSGVEKLLTRIDPATAGAAGSLAAKAGVGALVAVPGAQLAGHLISGDSRMNKLSSSKTPEDHSESRRKERAAHIPKKRLDALKKAVKDKQSKIPEGTHHVRLDNATAVIKDVGNKHVLATVLGPNMKAPGKDLNSTLL